MEIPYFPLVQMDFCSAPTCFLMVMMRRKIKLMPQVLYIFYFVVHCCSEFSNKTFMKINVQETLAKHLGLSIPADPLVQERFVEGNDFLLIQSTES